MKALLGEIPGRVQGIRGNMTKEDEPKSYITASIESKLHREISIEAKRNEQSFSKQVQEYKDKSVVLEGTVQELRERINKIQDVA